MMVWKLLKWTPRGSGKCSFERTPVLSRWAWLVMFLFIKRSIDHVPRELKSLFLVVDVMVKADGVEAAQVDLKAAQ